MFAYHTPNSCMIPVDLYLRHGTIMKPVLLSDHCGLILINGFHYCPGLVCDICKLPIYKCLPLLTRIID